VQLLDAPAVEDADRCRHVLHVLGTLLRGHEHFLDEHIAARFGRARYNSLSSSPLMGDATRPVDRHRTRGRERSLQSRASQQLRKGRRGREQATDLRRLLVAHQLGWRGDDQISLP